MMSDAEIQGSNEVEAVQAKKPNQPKPETKLHLGMCYKVSFLVLSMIQVFAGIICIIVGIYLRPFASDENAIYLTALRAGIWSGAFFVESGTAGCLATANLQNDGLISGVIVTSSFSFMASIALMAIEARAAELSHPDIALLRSDQYNSDILVNFGGSRALWDLHVTLVSFGAIVCFISVLLIIMILVWGTNWFKSTKPSNENDGKGRKTSQTNQTPVQENQTMKNTTVV